MACSHRPPSCVGKTGRVSFSFPASSPTPLAGELVENLNEKTGNSELKGYLDSVLLVSEKKFNFEKKSDSSRIRWGRLIVQAVKTYGELIKIEEIEDLRKEVDELKTVVKQKWH